MLSEDNKEINKKPTHVKPNLYAYYFLQLKEIAQEYGYNLVVHGSMNRDLDLIAIPWVNDPKPELELINALNKYLNGWTTESTALYLHGVLPGGRHSYVIQLNRGGYMNTGTGLHEPLTEGREVPEYTPDPQYYIDISVTPLGGVNHN
jgi:hypothetical protein